MKQSKFLKRGGLALAALAGYAAVLATFRRSYVQWGATEEEVARPLPGDELMDYASANHAITIEAPVQDVWPWLVQIGQDRAGFYSYSFLENLVLAGIHNTDKIVPAWQHLQAGDTIRLGSRKIYGDRPVLPVTALEKPHYLVLKGWGAFVLEPLDAHRTRFLIRSHGRQAGWLFRVLVFLFLDPIHFIMERKMMLGIKQRAEKNLS